MKTKNILLNLISLILIIFLFSGCSSGQRETADFMNNASNIFVNSKSLNTLSFNVALFSKQKIEKIDYVGIAGVNVNNNDYTVNIIDSNIDVLNSYKYKDLYIKYIMVEIIAKGDVENCTIKNIILNVDGVRQSLSFSTPVNHIFSEGNVFTEELQISVIPNEFPSSFINNEQGVVTYKFYATEDVVLQGIRLDNFLSVANVVYAIGEENPHSAHFPINVKKGETISISFSFTSDSANELSYVATNLYFDYLTTYLCMNLYMFFLLPLGLPYVNWASQEGCLFYLRSSLQSSDLPLFYFHGLFPSFSFSHCHSGLLFPILST